jgi:hypothetical protein
VRAGQLEQQPCDGRDSVPRGRAREHGFDGNPPRKRDQVKLVRAGGHGEVVERKPGGIVLAVVLTEAEQVRQHPGNPGDVLGPQVAGRERQLRRERAAGDHRETRVEPGQPLALAAGQQVHEPPGGGHRGAASAADGDRERAFADGPGTGGADVDRDVHVRDRPGLGGLWPGDLPDERAVKDDLGGPVEGRLLGQRGQPLIPGAAAGRRRGGVVGRQSQPGHRVEQVGDRDGGARAVAVQEPGAVVLPPAGAVRMRAQPGQCGRRRRCLVRHARRDRDVAAGVQVDGDRMRRGTGQFPHARCDRAEPGGSRDD